MTQETSRKEKQNAKYYIKPILDFLPLIIAICTIIIFMYNFENFKNLNLLYYYGLYSIVFILKFIKEFNDSKANNQPLNFNKIYHVGLDLALASGGVIIFMFTQINNSTGIALFVMLLIGLLIISSFIESIDYSKNIYLKNSGNIIIIFSVLYLTFYSFNRLKTSNLFNSSSDIKDNLTAFIINIPYDDKSLEKHIGINKMKNKKLLYTKIIYNIDEKTAIDDALKSFKIEIMDKPLFNDRTNSLNNIIEIDSSLIYSKKL